MPFASRSPSFGEAEPFDRASTVSRGLYAIVDLTQLAARGLDPIAFAQAILLAHPAALQVRAKELSARELLGLLRAVGALCRAARVPMVANDRVDLAVLAGCDYVHVGQEDLSVERVRRMAPALRVGVSTHTPGQLEAALLARPDYVAYGPVFPTTSKANPDACVGLPGLAVASARAREASTRLVAIGGVTEGRAPDLARLADACAAIHALLPSPASSSSDALYQEVTSRAKALHAALGGSPADTPGARA